MALKVGELYSVLGLDKKAFDSGIRESRTDIQALGMQLAKVGNTPLSTANLKTLKAEIKTVEKEALELRHGLINAIPGSEQAEAYAEGLEKVERRLALLKTQAEEVKGKMFAGADRLAGIGTKLTLGLTAPIMGLGAMIANKGMEFDALTKGLEAVAGGSDQAQRQLTELREVAKAPGLGFREAIQGSINLQAVGMSAEQSQRVLKGFGNALATVGKGKAELDGVITALSQMITKGKVSADEINQIAERVPQIRKVMQEAFGTADTEALQKKGITSEQFVEKVLTSLEKLPKVTGGVKNSWENMMDTLEQGMLKAWPHIEPIFSKGIELITKLADGFNNMSPASQKLVVGLFAVAAAIGPVLTLSSKLITSYAMLKIATETGTAANNAFSLSFLGIAKNAGIAALALASLWAAKQTYNQYQDMRKAQEDRDRMAEHDDFDVDAWIAQNKRNGGKSDIYRKTVSRHIGQWGGHTPQQAPMAAVQPVVTVDKEAERKALADAEAARSRWLDIQKRHVSDIDRLKIEWQEARRKAGPKESGIIDLDYQDRINAKLREQAEEQKKAAREVAEAESKAAWNSYVTRLEMAGRTYDAQKAAAYAAYLEEYQNLKALEAQGVNVRNRLVDAHTQYAAKVQAVDRDILAEQKEQEEARIEYRRNAEQAIDRIIEEQEESERQRAKNRLSIFEDLSLKLTRLVHGEGAARLEEIERERSRRAEEIEANVDDERARAAALMALDADAEEQRKALHREDEERQREKIRAAIGFMSISDVGSRAIETAMKASISDRRTLVEADPKQLGLLTQAVQVLTDQVNELRLTRRDLNSVMGDMA